VESKVTTIPGGAEVTDDHRGAHVTNCVVEGNERVVFRPTQKESLRSANSAHPRRVNSPSGHITAADRKG